ncbi:hypothetical protein LINGRAHAP2_LOCUS23880, partial [Linum grandiflorum]
FEPKTQSAASSFLPFFRFSLFQPLASISSKFFILRLSVSPVHRRRALSSFNPSLYAMATENCFSDCDGRISELHFRPGKRRRISSEANLLPELDADLLVEILIRQISNKLDLGDGQSFGFSVYRFRVVCIYQVVQPTYAIKLDVVCSESGEWTKEALVCDQQVKVGIKGVISCNGELFWRYDYKTDRNNGPKDLVAVFNPFRLDMPPASIDASSFRG